MNQFLLQLQHRDTRNVSGFKFARYPVGPSVLSDAIVVSLTSFFARRQAGQVVLYPFAGIQIIVHPCTCTLQQPTVHI